jgi:hypothetical protein
MVQTLDIIRNLVQSVPLPVEITLVTDNLNGTYTIESCNTYYLQEKSKLVINGVSYTVVSVANNESFTIKGSVAPPAITFNLAAPYFFHGTIEQANTELGGIQSEFQKTPMVYLQRPFPESVDPRAKRGIVEIERTADVVLYFLTQANFEKWKTDDHDKHAIIPMRNLMNAWIAWLEKRPSKVGFLDTYETLDMIKFGVLINDKGYESALFDDDLSGVRLSITLPLTRACCECCI